MACKRRSESQEAATRAGSAQRTLGRRSEVRDGREAAHAISGRVGRGQHVKGFVNQDKDFMLYSKCNRGPLNGFKQRSII